jgi:hypothetical protein
MIFLIEAVLRKNAYVAVVYCLFVLKRSSAFDGCVGEYKKSLNRIIKKRPHLFY